MNSFLPERGQGSQSDTNYAVHVCLKVSVPQNNRCVTTQDITT